MMRIITSKEGFAAALLFLWSFFCISNAADTITATQSVVDGQTVVSASGGFALGFFSPGSSRNRYLGIWLNRISNGTVIWIANRDSPINDTSGVLRVTDQGILTLLKGTNGVVWTSNSSRATQNPVAQLLESGNLVVRDGNDSNPENYLWQSLDHPTHIALPGMKFGMNLVTGIDRYLQSWKTSDDPSRGDFIYRFDSHGYPQMFLLKDSVEQFRSGPWNGLRFSGSPGLRPNSIYTYQFVFTQEEIYYRFDLVDSSVFTMLVFNPNGVLQRLTWNTRTRDWTTYLNAPADNCDTYGLCHAYGTCNIGNSPVCGCLDKFVPKNPNDWATADWSSGCVRRTPLNCQNGDGFLKYSGIKLPDTRNSSFNVTMTLEECRAVCLTNCSCMAYSTLNISGGSGCLLWFNDLMDIRQLSESGEDIYIRMASSEIGSKVGSSGKKAEKVGVSLASLAGILLLGLILSLYIWKRKKQKQQQQQQQQQEQQLMREGRVGGSEHFHTNESQKEDLELPLFDLATVSKATNGFSFNNKLGEGGFGPVYKGMLEDGQEIAVKRLSKFSTQGTDEFKNEVLFIAKLQHRNLVKLLGCCIKGEEKMLIYEYMPNKSLDSFIFDQNRRALLDWSKRFHIINGIARGLLYLHQDSRLRIIHRDLKASNILLDIDMNPKISDFGIARSFGGNETQANTNRVVGTYGYMSPEYASDGIFSVKSDVFSFGVLVLEIVCGKKNRGFFHSDHHHNLLGHAWMFYKEGRYSELIDSLLSDSLYLSEVLRSIHVGLLCVQQCAEDRPSMSSVVLMLGSEGALPQPREPGFFMERNRFFEGDSSSSKQAKSSTSEISITLLEAR